MEQHNKVNTLSILHFMLQGIQCCLDLSVVKKIVPLVWVEKTPNSLSYMLGVMDLAGKSVPIIDLALRLDLGRKQLYSLETPIILCQQEASETGMIVDTIVGIELIEKSLLQTNQNFLDNNSPVLGFVKIKDKLLIMLDASKILDKDVTINPTIMEQTKKLTGK